MSSLPGRWKLLLFTFYALLFADIFFSFAFSFSFFSSYSHLPHRSLWVLFTLKYSHHGVFALYFCVSSYAGVSVCVSVCACFPSTSSLVPKCCLSLSRQVYFREKKRKKSLADPAFVLLGSRQRFSLRLIICRYQTGMDFTFPLFSSNQNNADIPFSSCLSCILSSESL